MKLSKHLKKIIIDDIGWYGTLAILIAYGLLSFEVASENSLLYQILNLTGSIALTYISYKQKSWQLGVLNAAWAAIALIALIRIYL